MLQQVWGPVFEDVVWHAASEEGLRPSLADETQHAHLKVASANRWPAEDAISKAFSSLQQTNGDLIAEYNKRANNHQQLLASVAQGRAFGARATSPEADKGLRTQMESICNGCQRAGTNIHFQRFHFLLHHLHRQHHCHYHQQHHDHHGHHHHLLLLQRHHLHVATVNFGGE